MARTPRFAFTSSNEARMKWITREHVKVDRVACPWLIRKFVDPQAQFLFVAAGDVMQVAEQEDATPFDIPDDAALVLLARIVNGADTDNSLWNQPESAGLKAIATGFRRLGFKDDHELN